MQNIIQKLDEYVLVLSHALENDKNANDRPRLTHHLAMAANMYALINTQNDN